MLFLLSKRKKQQQQQKNREIRVSWINFRKLVKILENYRNAKKFIIVSPKNKLHPKMKKWHISLEILFVCMYVCMCVCVCIYIYIYTHTFSSMNLWLQTVSVIWELAVLASSPFSIVIVIDIVIIYIHLIIRVWRLTCPGELCWEKSCFLQWDKQTTYTKTFRFSSSPKVCDSYMSHSHEVDKIPIYKVRNENKVVFNLAGRRMGWNIELKRILPKMDF